MNLPTFIPAKSRVHRKRKQATPSAPPAALNLTAASAAISDDDASITLQFDRAIDVSAMDVTAIQVGTIATAQLYQGDGSPVVIDTYEESNVMLFASDASGIKAVDDGGTWSGTGGTGLPFP